MFVWGFGISPAPGNNLFQRAGRGKIDLKTRLSRDDQLTGLFAKNFYVTGRCPIPLLPQLNVSLIPACSYLQPSVSEYSRIGIYRRGDQARLLTDLLARGITGASWFIRDPLHGLSLDTLGVFSLGAMTLCR